MSCTEDAQANPADPLEAAEARMLDRVFDNYLMNNMMKLVDSRIAGTAPDPAVMADLNRAYRWLEEWLTGNLLPQHLSLVTCAAAPALFYADWVLPIPEDCPKLAALRVGSGRRFGAGS